MIQGDKPFFSVIVPVYNALEYIQLCLESLVNSAQKCVDSTGLPVEIICIDDGSTDGTGAFLDDYSLSAGMDRLKIVHQKNGGVSSARNRGLEEAKGEWVRFVDADDWVDEKLDTMLANAIVESEDTIDCIAFAITWMKDDGSIAYRMGADRQSTIMRGDDILGSPLYSQYSGLIWNKVLRRRLIEEKHLRFQIGMQPGEDDLFSILFLSQDVIVKVCPEITGYYYRMTPGSAIHTMTVKKSMFLADVFNELYRYWDMKHLPGLGKRLVGLAKNLVCLGVNESIGYRKHCIEALLSSKIFNVSAIPYLFFHGDFKSRLFAGCYMMLPKGLCRFLLLKMFTRRDRN